MMMNVLGTSISNRFDAKTKLQNALRVKTKLAMNSL